MYKLLLSLIVLFSNYCYSDNGTNISSDLVIVDKEKNILTFSGKEVIITFSDIVLKSNKVLIKLENDDTVDYIIIPEKFAFKKADNTVVIGNYANYNNKKNILIVTGDVQITQLGKIIRCNRLVYHTKLTKIATKK